MNETATLKYSTVRRHAAAAGAAGQEAAAGAAGAAWQSIIAAASPRSRRSRKSPGREAFIITVGHIAVHWHHIHDGAGLGAGRSDTASATAGPDSAAATTTATSTAVSVPRIRPGTAEAAEIGESNGSGKPQAASGSRQWVARRGAALARGRRRGGRDLRVVLG